VRACVRMHEWLRLWFDVSCCVAKVSPPCVVLLTYSHTRASLPAPAIMRIFVL